jgi:hypothetical protein
MAFWWTLEKERLSDEEKEQLGDAVQAEGYWAQKAGQPLAANPYAGTGDRYLRGCWAVGWVEAEEEQ